jgi:hypothetical protein
VGTVGFGDTYTARARFSFGYDSFYFFQACDSDSQSRLDKLAETVTAALQGIEIGRCSLNASIDNPDIGRLKDTIVGCGGGYYAIAFDGNGAVAQVRGDLVAGNESQILNCIVAANGDMTFPCLADVQICSTAVP